MTLLNFWWIMAVAAIVWFSTVTVIVAIRGAGDIRTMFERLDETRRKDQARRADAIAAGKDPDASA